MSVKTYFDGSSKKIYQSLWSDKKLRKLLAATSEEAVTKQPQ